MNIRNKLRRLLQSFIFVSNSEGNTNIPKINHNEYVGVKDYGLFLKEASNTLKQLVVESQDLNVLQGRMDTEASKWLTVLPEFNASSFKAGMFSGISLYMRILNDTSKDVKYIV